MRPSNTRRSWVWSGLIPAAETAVTGNEYDLMHEFQPQLVAVDVGARDV